MFSNFLKMITIDRNMSELWNIECKQYNFNISTSVAVIVWNICNSEHAAGWRICGYNPVSGKRYFSSPKCPYHLWDPYRPLLNGTQDYFSKLKRPELGANNVSTLMRRLEMIGDIFHGVHTKTLLFTLPYQHIPNSFRYSVRRTIMKWIYGWGEVAGSTKSSHLYN